MPPALAFPDLITLLPEEDLTLRNLEQHDVLLRINTDAGVPLLLEPVLIRDQHTLAVLLPLQKSSFVEEVLQVGHDCIAAQKSVDELAVLSDSCFLICEDSFLDLVLGSLVLLIEQLLHPIQLLLKLAVILIVSFPDQLGELLDLGVVHVEVGGLDIDVLALGVDVVVAFYIDALLLDLDSGVRQGGRLRPV